MLGSAGAEGVWESAAGCWVSGATPLVDTFSVGADMIGDVLRICKLLTLDPGR